MQSGLQLMIFYRAPNNNRKKHCSTADNDTNALQIFKAQLQPKYSQKTVIWFELHLMAVHCQWHQLLQTKYDVQTNYINFPHSLQLIQATVEILQ